MSHTQTLTHLYESELQPILLDLEQQRQYVRKRALLATAIIAPVTLVAVLLLIRWLEMFGVIAPIVLAIVAWGVVVGKAHQNYRSFFKAQVIARLARTVDPTLVYRDNSGIDQATFRASGIYRRGIDRYQSEDLFSGAVGATAFRFSEVHAEYKTTTTDSKGRRQTQWHTIFRGIFFVADFHKDFQGETYVLPDTAERALGGFGRMLQDWGSKVDGRPGDPVRLEDPEFEREFAVTSTDQVEARYILSTSLMRRLLNFRAQIDAPVAISFVNSQLYLAISTSRNYFEPPSIWRMQGALTQEEVAAYFADVRLAEDVVAELNLNTRIWSKQ